MLAAFLCGTMIAFQSPINARLGNFVGGPLTAAFCSFAVGTIALGAIMIFSGNIPRWQDMQQTSLWMWSGGILGAAFVSISISAFPILGAALMISLVVAGQMIAALLIDKTGFLLPEPIDISASRIVALVLIMAGVILFMRTR